MMDLILSNLTYETVFLGLLASLVFTILLYLIVSGLFSSINIETKEFKYGPMVIAYKTRTGAYKQAGELFTESYCLVPTREQIGIYYDDPETVPESDLRFAVGPILSHGDDPPSRKEMELLISHGFKIFHVPKAHFVVTTTFPFRTTLSIYMAIFRIYPKLRKYISERNLCAYPAIEVYTDSEIIFLMPLSRQEEFFIPEVMEEDISVATTDMGSVIGDRDTVSKDDDLFLKPRTPLRITKPRLSLEDVNESETSDEDKVDNSEPEEGSTTSSFDDLANDSETKSRAS
ncbi:testis-expressed protein 264 [Eurytemora carolleeae]|uniref:testis-expressed protein 264 n=1 Tax=Eurytemora carolleeae TaxID=1294199 RepID=UPI000C794E72|nr:testis-expressed protein 264 [Eurytemora carolleeae]|eukprot:XP_023336458.1 testis-expressed protein 264-like [Eurytemora affinis]